MQGGNNLRKIYFAVIVLAGVLVGHKTVSAQETLPSTFISLPNANITTNNSKWVYTGVALDPSIGTVSLNNIPQKFQYASWRQFDQEFTLKNGSNVIEADITLKDCSVLKQNVTITKLPSFTFSTNVSGTLSNIPKTKQPSMTFTGLVKDRTIKSMTINGIPSSIKWTWRQFDQTLDLKEGINKIEVIGYSDYTNTTELIRESYYIIREPDILKVSNLQFPETNISAPGMTITGMVNNSKAKSVKINGVSQELKWSW